ncbi:MAG: pilus assembly PilX N-terminal domain-containing protein [Gammaproteobacteria bacterium]|nr:pilus assembly PilX N-terminal domain-containing protein [Gammaproteobacteria bacterium]
MSDNGYRNAAGFTLISALFVIVVVSALGVYLTGLSTVAHSSSALAVRSSQAIYAAQAGVEWVVFRLAAGDSCGSLPTAPVIDGFSISVDACSTQTITEGSASYPLHDITVTASIGSYGDPAFVTRRLSAAVAG